MSESNEIGRWCQLPSDEQREVALLAVQGPIHLVSAALVDSYGPARFLEDIEVRERSAEPSGRPMDALAVVQLRQPEWTIVVARGDVSSPLPLDLQRDARDISETYTTETLLLTASADGEGVALLVFRDGEEVESVNWDETGELLKLDSQLRPEAGQGDGGDGDGGSDGDGDGDGDDDIDLAEAAFAERGLRVPACQPRVSGDTLWLQVGTAAAEIARADLLDFSFDVSLEPADDTTQVMNAPEAAAVQARSRRDDAEPEPEPLLQRMLKLAENLVNRRG